MSRNLRHESILALIEEKEIETQDELCEELAARGFPVTQATRLARRQDLVFLRFVVRKAFPLCLPFVRTRSGITDKMRALFRTCVQFIRPVGNLVIIKTLPGSGPNAGVVIDELAYEEVAGSIAGDDTVLLICETAEQGKLVADRLSSIVKG